jgi:hypothetical protein
LDEEDAASSSGSEPFLTPRDSTVSGAAEDERAMVLPWAVRPRLPRLPAGSCVVRGRDFARRARVLRCHPVGRLLPRAAV